MGMDFSEILKGTEFETKESKSISKTVKISLNDFMDYSAKVIKRDFIPEVFNDNLMMLGVIIDGISSLVADVSFLIFGDKINIDNTKETNKKVELNEDDVLSAFLFLATINDEKLETYKIINNSPRFKEVILLVGYKITKEIFG